MHASKLFLTMQLKTLHTGKCDEALLVSSDQVSKEFQDSAWIRRLLAHSRSILHCYYQIIFIRADWSSMGLNAGLIEAIEG